MLELVAALSLTFSLLGGYTNSMLVPTPREPITDEPAGANTDFEIPMDPIIHECTISDPC